MAKKNFPDILIDLIKRICQARTDVDFEINVGEYWKTITVKIEGIPDIKLGVSEDGEFRFKYDKNIDVAKDIINNLFIISMEKANNRAGTNVQKQNKSNKRRSGQIKIQL